MKIPYKESWYYKEVQRLKKIIKSIYGEECMICKSTKNLQLHHKHIAPDSIVGKDNESGYDTIKRKRESIKHPERFLLICLSGHNKIEPRALKLRHQTLEVR